MKDLKNNYYNKQILSCLLDENIVPAKLISKTVGLSEKSIRSKISDINDYLKENNLGKINRKPRIGIWLEIDDLQKEKLETILINNSSITASYKNEERLTETLKILFKLRPWETISTQKLSEYLYLSSTTVLKVLKECEQWLSYYNIKIVSSRNKGFQLKYSENEYRIALKSLIMSNFDINKIKDNINYFFFNIDTKMIENAIIQTENQWNYKFTDESFYEILIYCCIAYARKDINIPKLNGKEEFEILQKYNEYKFTLAIFKKLQENFHILFCDEDILFLAIQIMCSKFIGISETDQALEQVKEYDNKLLEFVDLILKIVGNILGIELINDEKLKESLIFHLRPTIFRIRYGTPHNNSLINFIKDEYKNVFRATLSISIIFEEFYGIQLTEDEIGYIVLYIQSAIERKSHNYNMLLISDYSRGHSQLISEQIKKMIPEISDITIISTHDFKLYRNIGDVYNNIDIIVSSKELDIKDNRIIVIPNLINKKGILNLRQNIDNLNYTFESSINSFSPVCFPLLDPGIIFVHQKFSNKDELLKFMSDSMESRGFVTNKFFDSVMEREKATTTSIGNGISLTHGFQSEVIDCKVAIAILDNPIIWDNDKVDIVFLLAFKATTPDEINRIQMFYKEYISLIETDKKINILKNMDSNIELYKYLIQ